MDQEEFEILELIERGGCVFQPVDSTPEGRSNFQAVVMRLLYLRAVGLIRLHDGRLMQAANGTYLMAGPCDLTPAGIAALSHDRSLGPRPNQAPTPP